MGRPASLAGRGRGWLRSPGPAPPGRALPRAAQGVAAQSLGGGGNHRQGGGRAAPGRRRAGQQADRGAAAAVAADRGEARGEPAAQDRRSLEDRPGGGRITADYVVDASSDSSSRSSRAVPASTTVSGRPNSAA